MSFFKHVQLHKYDLTDKGVSQACYDEITTELADAKNALTEEQLWVLADDMRENWFLNSCVWNFDEFLNLNHNLSLM